MKDYTGLSKYHVGVLAFYGIVTPFLLAWYSSGLRYAVDAASLKIVLIMLLASALYFLGRAFGWIEKQRISPSELIATLLYAFAFAFPEEIIFRGIIQSHIQTFTGSAVATIALSALIFGLAHLPNGSRGIQVLKWNWRFAGLACAGGLLFGLLFFFTGNLLPSTLLHAFILIFLRFLYY